MLQSHSRRRHRPHPRARAIDSPTAVESERRTSRRRREYAAADRARGSIVATAGTADAGLTGAHTAGCAGRAAAAATLDTTATARPRWSAAVDAGPHESRTDSFTGQPGSAAGHAARTEPDAVTDDAAEHDADASAGDADAASRRRSADTADHGQGRRLWACTCAGRRRGCWRRAIGRCRRYCLAAR